jgi:hypothetical protein
MGWWQDVTAYLDKEGATIKKAPLAFVSLLVLGLAGGGIGGLAWRGQELANANTLADSYKADVTRLQAEVDRYKELRQRMQAIDDSFTERQVEDLEGQLGIVPPGEVEIVAPKEESAAWDQIYSAFKNSGWKVSTTSQLKSWADLPSYSATIAQASTRPTVLLSTSDNEASQSVRDAFEAAGIPYIEREIAAGESQTPQVWVIPDRAEAEAWLKDVLPERGRLEPSPSDDSPSVFVPALPSDSGGGQSSDETFLPMDR